MSLAPKSKTSKIKPSKTQLAKWRIDVQAARCENQSKLLAQLQSNKLNAEQFQKQLDKSITRVAKLEASVPVISFPDALPISQRRTEIAHVIKDNQVVIIAGETGSGKTTQIPKICLHLGLGNKGLIGHTQPRRIAARTVADRIASELQSKVGDVVGYQVRFTDVASENTRIKLMTDGVLLAEFQRDRMLSRYEVIIIDEAHERSLNIDFLLGLLKRLCIKRADLKIIITSATIDLEKFAEHFSSHGKPAPIVEVSGRTYPVETLYQPPSESARALPDLITETVNNVIRNEAKGHYKINGDILVFCAGEREIRDAAHALRQAQLPIEVLPLYSRLSVKEQNKVFQSAQRRKVVLATNVAETSITVPGIAYVIDPGLARISRYSFRSKVQRLPIEAISKASANQRMGRCGRVANGVCIRLYSQDDFEARDEFTPAEILRSNLAAVILKMLRMKVSDIDQFEFIDRPDKRLLNDGFKLLEELGAIKKDRNGNDELTKLGRQMSDLPVDPRYARILVAAQQTGCLRDTLIVVSALSIQDPRERPVDKQQASDQAHRELAHPQSDFYSYLNLWQAINNERSALSNTKFKQRCVERYWSIARIFEWRELYRQLTGICKGLGWSFEPWVDLTLPNPTKLKAQKTNADSYDVRYEVLHKSLLSGLLSHIATKELDGEYLAARGRRIHLFPGSSQHKRQPKWLIAAEFLETSKLFAHTVASVKPQWIIASAKHLCRYNYSSAHYQARSGAVTAQRKTLLFGLTLRDKEAINYGPINPQESRIVFIQEALIGQQYKPRNKRNFMSHNQSLIRDIETLENKTRRRNLLISDEQLYDFFAQRLPANINNRKSLEKWLNGGNEQVLELRQEQLLAVEINQRDVAQFPDSLDVNGKKISVSYKFEPGQAEDGVTLSVPVTVLAHFPEHIGDWLVPGLLRDKCVALIKTLPKPIRRQFAPAADSVNRVFGDLQPNNTALTQNLANGLNKVRGIKIEPVAWDLNKLDPFYLMNYCIIDTDGSIISKGRDLKALKARYADSVQSSVVANDVPERDKLEQHNISDWNFGELKKSIIYQHQGMTITAYPMLKIMDDGSVSLLISDKAATANYQTNLAILQLAQNVLKAGAQKQSYHYLYKELLKTKPRQSKKQKPNNGLSSLASQKVNPKANQQSAKSVWLEELILAALRESCFSSGVQTIRNDNNFKAALNTGAKNWVATAIEFENTLVPVLESRDQILASLSAVKPTTVAIDEAIEDIKAQLYRLFEPFFLRYTSIAELKQYPRYLKAVTARLDKLTNTTAMTPDYQALLAYQEKLNELIKEKQDELGLDFVYASQPDIKKFSNMLEEWRVSLFAQNLKTLIPVSEKRISKAWQALADNQ